MTKEFLRVPRQLALFELVKITMWSASSTCRAIFFELKRPWTINIGDSIECVFSMSPTDGACIHHANSCDGAGRSAQRKIAQAHCCRSVQSVISVVERCDVIYSRF